MASNMHLLELIGNAPRIGAIKPASSDADFSRRVAGNPSRFSSVTGSDDLPNNRTWTGNTATCAFNSSLAQGPVTLSGIIPLLRQIITRVAWLLWHLLLLLIPRWLPPPSSPKPTPSPQHLSRVERYRPARVSVLRREAIPCEQQFPRRRETATSGIPSGHRPWTDCRGGFLQSKRYRSSALKGKYNSVNCQ